MANRIIFPSRQPLLDWKNHAADHMDGFGRRCASTRRNSGVPFGSAGGRWFSLRVVLEGFEGLMLAKMITTLKKASKIWGFFCGFYLGDIPCPLNQNKIINIWWYFCPFKCFCPVEKNCRFFFGKWHVSQLQLLVNTEVNGPFSLRPGGLTER